MNLKHQNINIPSINCDGSIESLTANMYNINRSLTDTIENVQEISCFIENYVEYTLKEYEKQLTEKIALRTYDVISEIVECNIRKEEFLNLLLHDETSDANG